VLEERIARFKVRSSGGISYRESGSGRALVLLHGIGSSSAGWLNQLEGVRGFRLIAWDAPGYGESAFLSVEKPSAREYGEALAGFVERLLLKDIVLVASSLGALMAGAFAKNSPALRAMMLISPAGGYGGDTKVLNERLKALDQLGPEGMAEKRSPTLLGAKAPPEALELVRWSQRRVRPAGYRQAAYCLSNGRLAEDARSCRRKVLVVCGTEDRITPEAGCKAVAQAFPDAEYRSLPGIGHLAHIEDPTLINRTIADFAA
jgi:pimeloyl-ACP methyl ester carboxylesterase